jgi:hypothetical protein
VSKSDLPDQMSLFDADSAAGEVLRPRPWRATPADTWRAEKPPSASILEHGALDLLRRNLEFLRAMELHAGNLAAIEVQSFRERHEELIMHLVRWRTDGDEEAGRAALSAMGDLADLRLRALEQLNPALLGKVVATEPRVPVRDVEIERGLSMAEVEVAEARGEVVEFAVPGLPDTFGSSGLVSPGMVRELVRAQMNRMKAQHERRPLPRREGLGALLRDLPVEWLDAIWEELGLGPDLPRHRKERERTIARHLATEGIVAKVVGEGLSTQGRRLLAFLLEHGGKAPAADVVLRFGSDEGDGWFWNEEPPTSVLGQVRLCGLAFVGAADAQRGTRTVVVPRELRQGLGDALALAEPMAEEGGRRQEEGRRREGPASGLRPELVEALKAAFPDGMVEPAWDGSPLEDVEDDLRSKLAGLEGARLLYQRTLEGDETWDLPEGFGLDDSGDGAARDGEGDWENGDEGTWKEPGRSYGVFFLSPVGEGFRFLIQGDFMEETGEVIPTSGAGEIGWAVAVSSVAPFALLRVGSLEVEERFGVSSPDIEPRYFTADGGPEALENVFQDMLGPEERVLLDDLRRRINGVLQELGIAALGEEQARHTVPWLQLSHDVLPGRRGGAPITLEDALFFRIPG